MTDFSGHDDPPPAGPEPPAPPTRSKTPLIIGGVIVVVILVAVAVVLVRSRGGNDSKQVLRGSFILIDKNLGSVATCAGSGGYSDFVAGQPVKITNSDGKVVGTGSTRHVKTSKDREELSDRLSSDREVFANASDAQSGMEDLENAGRACPLLFDVPIETSDSYKIQIGDGRLGNQTYTQDQLVKKKFVTNLILGG